VDNCENDNYTRAPREQLNEIHVWVPPLHFFPLSFAFKTLYAILISTVRNIRSVHLILDFITNNIS
jgi:hypothetical protein